MTDPLTPQEREDLQWYLEKYWKWPFEGFLKRGKQVEALLAVVGKRLYETVFGSREAISMVQAWRLYPGVERQLSIVSDVPRALSLPWELLHDGQGFLVLRTRQPVTILRRLPQHELAAFPTAFTPPLRVLLVTARPEGAPFSDQRGIARELLEAVEGQEETGNAEAIKLEFLRPPTLRALRARLSDAKRPQVHVLHFDGHGIFEGELGEQHGLNLIDRKQGLLAFEDVEGKLDLVRAEDVAQVLQDSGVRLAVLTACQSALGAADDAFSSVAAQLIQSGVDTVVAMSASFMVAGATIYAETFYRELSEGTPAPRAQERARQVLHDNPRHDAMRRRRNEEGKPVELRDWWLPHFYQQRPLLLQPTRSSRKRRGQPSISALPRLCEGMPAEPRYSFCGRARELLQIERWLLRGRLVIIQGFGGVGKTALAREAADWLTRTDMFDGACFVSFEHGADAVTLLSTLGNYLGIYDGNYNPHESKAALARLALVLKEKRILLLADNLESILPGGEAPLEAGIRNQLWDVLLELHRLGARVILTSRATAFGDGRLAPGSRVAYLELQGLHADDAYELASRILDDLGIDRARAPYAELRDLLAQLDHLPLAIQQVLPMLRDVALWKIRADFTELVPKEGTSRLERG